VLRVQTAPYRAMQCLIAHSCFFLSALVPLAFWAEGDLLLTDLQLSNVRESEQIVLPSRVCLYWDRFH